MDQMVAGIAPATMAAAADGTRRALARRRGCRGRGGRGRCPRDVATHPGRLGKLGLVGGGPGWPESSREAADAVDDAGDVRRPARRYEPARARVAAGEEGPPFWSPGLRSLTSFAPKSCPSKIMTP